MDKIKAYINNSKAILNLIDDQDIYDVLYLLNGSKTIYLCGNGGSSATASHLANDFQKISNLEAFCLTDSTPLITAWGNDSHYKHIFSNQLKVVGKEGDTLIVITGSGNSENLINAIHTADLKRMHTIAFVGGDGGLIKSTWSELVDILIHIPSDMQHAEDWHLVIGHIICGMISK